MKIQRVTSEVLSTIVYVRIVDSHLFCGPAGSIVVEDIVDGNMYYVTEPICCSEYKFCILSDGVHYLVHIANSEMSTRREEIHRLVYSGMSFIDAVMMLCM